MSSPTKSPPEYKFTYHKSLEPFNKTMRQWLVDNNKHWDGLATGALVFNPQNKILLVQRAATDSMPNKWEIPGGAADEEDPSLLHACARELWEEAGLVATRLRRIHQAATPRACSRTGRERGSSAGFRLRSRLRTGIVLNWIRRNTRIFFG